MSHYSMKRDHHHRPKGWNNKQTKKQTNKKQIKQIKEKEENGKVVQHFSGRGTKYERGVLKD